MSKGVKIVEKHFERALVAYQHEMQFGAGLRGCLAGALDAYLNPPKPACRKCGKSESNHAILEDAIAGSQLICPTFTVFEASE